MGTQEKASNASMSDETRLIIEKLVRIFQECDESLLKLLLSQSMVTDASDLMVSQKAMCSLMIRSQKSYIELSYEALERYQKLATQVLDVMGREDLIAVSDELTEL